jgi:hypothetical protein
MPDNDPPSPTLLDEYSDAINEMKCKLIDAILKENTEQKRLKVERQAKVKRSLMALPELIKEGRYNNTVRLFHGNTAFDEEKLFVQELIAVLKALGLNPKWDGKTSFMELSANKIKALVDAGKLGALV